MGKYVENEEVLIFKNKDYDCSVYPDCLVDKTFQTGKIIHFDEITGEYWARGVNGENFVGRHYYDSNSDENANAIIISRSELILLVYKRLKALSESYNDNMKFNFTLFHWFNAIAQNTKLIGNDIVILNDKTSEYGIMADPNAHLEVGERVCAFNCNTGKSDDKLECVFEALRNNDGYTAVTIESRVEDSVNSMYIATFGSKNECTLQGYYAKAYQGNNVLLRKQDLMRLLSAKSKMLTEKIKADERMIEKLLSLYYKLAGDTIGDKGYIPETVAAYDYRKGER